MKNCKAKPVEEASGSVIQKFLQPTHDVCSDDDADQYRCGEADAVDETSLLDERPRVVGTKRKCDGKPKLTIGAQERARYVSFNFVSAHMSNYNAYTYTSTYGSRSLVRLEE